MVRDQWNIYKKCIWDNEKGGGIISTIDQTDRKKSFMSSQGEKYKREFFMHLNWLKELLKK